MSVKKLPAMSKVPVKIVLGNELQLGGYNAPPSFVGEKKNYNLQPGITDYVLWPFSTIEWVTTQNKFKARALVQNKITKDIVVFNSWHQDFSDSERAIGLVSDSLKGIGDRRVYNVFAETIETHTSDIGAGQIINVTETLALIWSMQQY